MIEKYKILEKSHHTYYRDFWEIVDAFMNDTLYILIGLSFLYVKIIDAKILVAIIIINLVARAVGVATSTKLMGKVPDGMKLIRFSALLTWGGLKGGLSLALVISSKTLLSNDIYNIFLSITYATIVFTTIVQGLSTTKVYQLLMSNKKKVNASVE